MRDFGESRKLSVEGFKEVKRVRVITGVKRVKLGAKHRDHKYSSRPSTKRTRRMQPRGNLGHQTVLKTRNPHLVMMIVTIIRKLILVTLTLH